MLRCDPTGSPKEAVLLELLRYSHYLGKNQSEPRYSVVVLASTGEPKWVCSGNAEAIEQNVQRYQEAARDSTGDPPVPSRRTISSFVRRMKWRWRNSAG